MGKVTPWLSFKDNAEDAMNFYLSVFKNSKAGFVSRYPEGGPVMPGQVMVAEFELEGQKIMALNGLDCKFTEAFSFSISCQDQEEVDYFWEKLIADGGEESQCGWLKDKFGLSWQVVPSVMGQLMNQKDPEKAKRAMAAMMKMKKIIIKDIEDALEGK